MSHVAILGGGLIGAGWAAAFAGAGHETRVLDPAPEAAARVAELWETAQPVLDRLGQLRPEAVPPRVVTDMAELAGARFVQEALPEDLSLKQRVFRDLAPHVETAEAVASSSSSFPPDRMAESTGLEPRFLIGHPCNPPYLMPVVEISAASACAPEAIAAARTLYEGLGKTVLTLNRPVAGHLVNRLQVALWREAVHLVTTGAASLEDTERAVTEALGPRWSMVGPHSVFALSGGARGMEGFLEALGPAFQDLFDDLGTPRLDDATKQALAEAYARADLPPLPDQARDRDARLPGLLAQLAADRNGSN